MDTVEAVFRDIQAEYDFDNFSIECFCAYLSKRQGREIVLRPRVFGEVAFTGIWIQRPDLDYVYYATDVHPIHQMHSIIHEFAHIILNHTPLPVTSIPQVMLFRNPKADPKAEEREAEAFARLVMPFLIRNRRNSDFSSEYE